MNPSLGVHGPEIVDGARRHENQRVCLDWKMVKIDVE